MLAYRLLINRIRLITNAAILSLQSIVFSSVVCAQIVPDNTLGTKVNLIDGQQKIIGGMELGDNLFHSFQEFSPQADFVTHFDNSSNIVNIFTRVTGNSVSFIDGLIRANGNTSLFILNPAGIIFGNNAQLDISGSFIATTAESLIFADGTKFDSQIDQNPPLLTVSIPIGLQFGTYAGTISSNNIDPINLTVESGKNIAFLGGNIELQNIIIKAFSGNVEIGSVAKNEVISLPNIFDIWKFNYDNVEKFNDIKIGQNSGIDTSGKLGSINLQGRNILLDVGVELRNATNKNFEGDETGEIHLLANNQIDLNNAVVATEVSGFDGDFQPLPNPVKGKGGNIIISAKDIKIRNGALITALTQSEGQGGDIKIDADVSLEVSGANNLLNQTFPSLILTSTLSSGKGGNIDITTGKLFILDGAKIDASSFEQGDAGNINLNANESIFISGNIKIKDFFGDEAIVLSGLSASSGREDLQSPFGQSGKITVTTPQLLIENGGEISVSNLGEENSGNIEINARELLLSQDSKITAETASGDGGSININSNDIVLKNDSSITTTAGGKGNGGNITINTNNLVLLDESNIQADADLGNGGNVTITTQSLLTEKNPEEVITANSTSKKGIDGVVEITLPDDNSKLETTQARIASLAGEESLYKGCSLGTDFSANRFSYIGRGGIRKGPFDPLESQDAIADLGFGDESEFQNINIQTNNDLSDYDKIKRSSTSITEATVWVINERGKVELVAQAPNYSVPSECLFK